MTPNADTVAALARQLLTLVDRDAANGDASDLQCLKNHGLIWHQLDLALIEYESSQIDGSGLCKGCGRPCDLSDTEFGGCIDGYHGNCEPSPNDGTGA